MDDFWGALGYLTEQVKWFYVDLSDFTGSCIVCFCGNLFGKDN